MILFRTLYLSDSEDKAVVIFYDEENSKIWKEKMNMRSYIDLHCLYYEILEVSKELSEYP